MASKITSKADVEQLLDKYDNFLFDCDGVIWLGSKLLPHVIETLNMLRSRGKKLIFVTNNSSKSREDYVKKFKGFGLTVAKDEMFGSAYASAVYTKQILKLPTTSKVWVMGGSGIEVEMAECGYETIGGTKMPELDKPMDLDNPNDPIYSLDDNVGAVCVGLDTSMDYHRLAMTLQYLRRPEVAFIATNIDSTYPAHGFILPGAGTVVRAAAECSGREPVSCGKPSPGMMDAIVESHGIDRRRSIMVGDRLNTDMKFGRDGGLSTLLVLTGIESESTLQATAVKPTYFASKLGDLYEMSQ